MLFRIGINVGDVMVKDGDIFGDGVNVAARLQTLADAGGICVSRGVRDNIRHLAGFSFEDLGEQVVKNIARPVRAFRVTIDQEAVADARGDCATAAARHSNGSPPPTAQPSTSPCGRRSATAAMSRISTLSAAFSGGRVC